MKFAIVDDNPIIRQLVTLWLEDAGHSVKSYESGRLALRETPSELPDCVIIDIMMPDMDGFELCRELRLTPGFGAVKIIIVRGNQIEMFGPYQGDLTIERAVEAQMQSGYFPITVREFAARLVYRDLREETLNFGPVRIDTMLLRHPGYCLGYRLTCYGRSVCYITDNELYLPTHPHYDTTYVERLADFVWETDLLIADTTYRDEVYPAKVDWGHSCVSEVADLASRAQVRRLHLFHHDPDQDDDEIDLKLQETREALSRLGSKAECDAPAEKLRLVL